MLICCSFFVFCKRKTVGVARQQRHFLCSDKENEAKESLTLRWTCFARCVLVANVSGTYLWRSTLPPLSSRPLRPSRVQQADMFVLFQSLLIDSSKIEPVRTKENNTTERVSQEARVLERRALFQMLTQDYKRFRQLAKELPSARRRHFCILLLPGKMYGVWRYANRRLCL